MLNVGLAGSVQESFDDNGVVHLVSDSFTGDLSWENAVFQDSLVDNFDTSADWSLLLVATGAGGFGFLGHDFPGADDQNVFAGEFLLEFSDDFGLDLLPSGNLWGWDHQDQSVSSADIDFFDGVDVKLHKLFLGGGIGTVLDFENGLGDVVLDVGRSLVVFLLEFGGDGSKNHVRRV